ncbi:NEK5 [Symbiodinium sp. CCMP2592]|nr:NEK5 [Symbiodinium sp. CCMP2592]
MAMVLLVLLVPMFLPSSGDGGAEECFLQLGRAAARDALNPTAADSPFEKMQKPWTERGIRFQQCPKPRSVPPSESEVPAQPLLLAELPQLPLPPKKPECPPGSMLIGVFDAAANATASYSYSCCNAGEQCGGCSYISGGKCTRCSAGFVRQTIPVINKTKCFLCDDVAGWKDAAGHSCEDYAAVCNGSWPEPSLDVAFQKLRPSEACCACGGGSLYPTPVDLPLSSASLYKDQKVDSSPEPFTAEITEVDQGCSLSAAGLELSTSGRINGTVGSEAQALQCGITFIQDPIRGISFAASLDVTVTEFSYGSPVLMFKAWGLDEIEEAEATKHAKHSATAKLSNFELECDPACSWLSVNAQTGELTSGRSLTGQGLPPDMWGAVQGFPGVPGCSCVASAANGGNRSSSRFVALQARFWKAGSYDSDVQAQEVGSPIVPVKLREALGRGLVLTVRPGLRWFERPGHELSVPAIQDAQGRSFVVPAVPSILDVQCTAPGLALSWSRITGDVSAAGEVAFNLDPDGGSVSGTPSLGLMQAAGRARLTVSCHVALGGRRGPGLENRLSDILRILAHAMLAPGPLYDRALPAATINVQLLDNVCWVPGQLDDTLRWRKFSCDQLSTSALQLSMGSEVGSHRRRHHPKHCKKSHACLQKCRETPSCGAAYVDDDCWVQSSDGSQMDQKNTKDGRLLIRVNNCSHKTAELLLEAPGAQLVAGTYSPSDDYHNSVSYSRMGQLPEVVPERQLVLARDVRRSLPTSCEGSSWLLVHANASDFTSSTTAAQYYGEVMACLQGDVVQEAFDRGIANFSLHFLNSVIDDPFQFGHPSAKQSGDVSIAAPSCSKPQSPADLLYGTVQVPDLYSLSACECFGEAYANMAPVDPESNAAVPRNGDGAGDFNVNPLDDQLIFIGRYTCESSAGASEQAMLLTIQSLQLEECKQACHEQDNQCRFYLLEKASQVCTLFSACDAIQYVSLELSNELWGVSGVGDVAGKFCRIADPQSCWEDVLRRSYLSPAPSNLPRCAFQKQFEACDALQLLSGEAFGTCTRCEYLPADLSEVKQSMKKIPLPEEFSSGSQLQASCNTTSRMFAGVLGPKSSTVFTCVGGDWVGEEGPWRDLENLTCQQCLQVGTEDLQRLTNVSQGAAYFLAQRRIQATYDDNIPGCESASLPTAAKLVSTATGPDLALEVDKEGNVSLSPPNASGTLWWIDAETGVLRLKSPELAEGSWCLCFDHSLTACKCRGYTWTLDRSGRLSNGRSRCISEKNGTLELAVCPQRTGPRSRWYFEGGNCMLNMAMVDTAELTWNVSAEASGSSLLLAEITDTVHGIGSFSIYNSMYTQYSLSARHDGSVVAASKTDFQWLARDGKILFNDLGLDTYLLGFQNGSVGTGSAKQANGADGQWTCSEDGGLTKSGPSALRCINASLYKQTTRYAPVAAPYQGHVHLDGPNRFEARCPRGFIRGWSTQVDKHGLYPGIHVDCTTFAGEGELEGCTYNDFSLSVSSVGPGGAGTPFNFYLRVWQALGELTSVGCGVTKNGDPTAMSSFYFDVYPNAGAIHFHCCPMKALRPDAPDAEPVTSEWFTSADMVNVPACPDHYVMRGLEFHGDPNGGPTVVSNNCLLIVDPGLSSTESERTPAALGYPAYFLSLVPPDRGGSCPQKWSCKVPPPGTPLGTCEAEVFVETPFDVEFKDGRGSCASVLDGGQPTQAVKVSDYVKWRCSTDNACLGFQSQGSDSSGPGILFMEAVKAVSKTGGDGAACFVKVASSWSPEESVPLSLEVKQEEKLQRPLRAAYNATRVIQLRTGDEDSAWSLFSCMPNGITSDAPVSLPPYIRCGIVTMRLSDLLDAVGVYKGRQNKILNLDIQKTCATLMPAGSGNARDASMKGEKLLALLQGQMYFSTFLGNPQLPPFNQSGATEAWLLGHGSLTQFGKVLWGLNCPDGAIVTSSPTTQPHCLQVGAGAQTEHEVLSGSAFCPAGSAVSGWYNLPGQPVRGSGTGGPTNWLEMRLFCRPTNLLASCQQLMNPTCQKGEVLAGISYSSNSMRVKCCLLQRRVGLRLMPQGSKPVQKDFEGYYCPTGMDRTGAPFYTRTLIPDLGTINETAANATLSWDKWTAEWQVRVKHSVVRSLHSDVVLPAEIDFSSADNFSAVPIGPLPSFAKKPKPASPFPKHPPAFPKLLKFEPVQPDYKAYCDPTFLQNPALFAGGGPQEGNPCYHTFNAEKPVPGLPKGITEEDFWQACGRSHTRKYLFAHAASEQSKLENWIKKRIGELQDVTDIAALAAAVATAIPWGSYSSPASSAKKVASKEAEKVAKKVVEKKVEQGLISKAKAFASKVKVFASKSIKTASTAYAKAQKAVEAVKGHVEKAQKTYEKVKGLPGKVQKKAVGGITDAQSVINNYSPIKIPSELQLKKTGQKLQAQTLPEPSEPGDDSYSNAESQSQADHADWMPLQYGLSKVMCDLFCIHNSVTAGTSAVLQSLQESNEVLTTNIEQLLHYETEYLLYKIGFLQPQKRAAQALAEASTVELLQDLRALPASSRGLSRDVLAWHQEAGELLLSRAADLGHNASVELWPYRLRALRASMQHFQVGLSRRLQGGPDLAAAARKQAMEKLQVLQEHSAQQRVLGEQAKRLRLHMPQPALMDGSTQILWNSLLESFLRAHEKHAAFTMLRMQALDRSDEAIHMAANFSQCRGADTSALQEAWQHHLRAEERAGAGLQEAWAATLAATERLQVAMEDEGLIPRLMQGVDLHESFVTERLDGCESRFQEVSQQIFSHAVEVVNRAVQPLLMQLITFQALHGYQKAQLLSAGLRYVPTASPALGLAALKRELAAAAAGGEEEGGYPSSKGRALAQRALDLLGRRACPAPAHCGSAAGAMLVASGWAVEEPGDAAAVACSLPGASGDAIPSINASNIKLVLTAEPCSSLVLLDAMGSFTSSTAEG